MGAQTCNPQGTGFDPCKCGGSMSTCGDGVVEGTEECDDGNTMNGDSCDSTCKNETCGNETKDPGECGPEGTCPQDCGNCGNGMEDPGECGMGGTCPMDCDPCKDAVTFAGLAPMASGPVWQFAGFTGIDAGNEMCKQIGADHICTHAELRKAEMHVDPMTMKNELASIAAGTSIWLHREDTDMVMVNNVMTAGGAGARCNDWKYETNHISDGEFCDLAANGVLNCSYDSDPVYDGLNPGVHVQAGLNCGGVSRSITCCFEECKP
jgi:cysteine-rich repeat protein